MKIGAIVKIVKSEHRMAEVDNPIGIYDGPKEGGFIVVLSSGLTVWAEKIETVKPLLYLANPIRLFTDPEKGITVVRNSEFIIRSGMDIQAKQFEEWVSSR